MNRTESISVYNRMITSLDSAFSLQRGQRNVQTRNNERNPTASSQQCKHFPQQPNNSQAQRLNPPWGDMVSGQKRKEVEKNTFSQWDDIQCPFLHSHARSDMSGLPSQLRELCAWANSRSLHEQNWLVWVRICVMPFTRVTFRDWSIIRNRLNLVPGATNTYIHVKYLYPRYRKKFLLLTRKSSYLYPSSDLGVQWVWASRKGSTKYGNGPEPAWREKSTQYSNFRKVSNK